MSDRETTEFVVARVRSSLPEFCKRNGITLTDSVLDNLAHWVVGTIPSGYAREYCSSGPYPCACTGWCGRWEQVVPVPWKEEE